MTQQEGAGCVLRLFGAPAAAVKTAVGNFPPQWKAAAQWKSRGAETLVALQAPTAAGLKKALQALRTAFPADLYGEGGTTLPSAVVETLEHSDRLLVCADAEAGALLNPRLETVKGADAVFDFGALSYAHPQTNARVEKRARAHLPGDCTDPVRLTLARVQAARRVVGADLAVGCARRQEDCVLVLGSKKGCWLRTIPAGENAALWLLDMIRRAAAGKPQAEGTGFLPARQAEQGKTVRPEPRKHPLRRAVLRLLVLLLLLAAGAAAAWWYTGGDFTALPERLSALWTEHQPRPGATLV